MFDFIRGQIHRVAPTQVILEVGGVGFDVNISFQTFQAIQSSKEVSLYTRFLAKNDGQNLSTFVLYGFQQVEERAMFDMLTSISGIGNNLALTMLSAHPVEAIQQAIYQGNESFITAIKGIGPKTAKRLILELKDKVNDGQHFDLGSNNPKDEALKALLSLGFQRNTIMRTLDAIIQELPSSSVEELIKLALKRM